MKTYIITATNLKTYNVIARTIEEAVDILCDLHKIVEANITCIQVLNFENVNNPMKTVKFP